MNEFFGHHELRSRHLFQGDLELASPLRLSSGRASTETDAPLMRTRDGIPYIPGSSLRGALRSEVERIVGAVGELEGLRSCVLFDTDADDEAACLTAAGQKEHDRLRDRLKEGKEAEVLAELQHRLCDVCRLFGSPLFASRLVIEDAYPAGGDLPAAKTMVRDGVGIHRDTGTAANNVKFDFEVLEPGPYFALRMQVENMTDGDRKLMRLVLGLLRQGLFVGGKRAAGLGKIRLSGEAKVTGFEDPKALWRALMTGDDPHVELAWEGGA